MVPASHSKRSRDPGRFDGLGVVEAKPHVVREGADLDPRDRSAGRQHATRLWSRPTSSASLRLVPRGAPAVPRVWSGGEWDRGVASLRVVGLRFPPSSSEPTSSGLSPTPPPLVALF